MLEERRKEEKSTKANRFTLLHGLCSHGSKEWLLDSLKRNWSNNTQRRKQKRRRNHLEK